MITILLVTALGYLLFKAYTALMPRILENNLRKDKTVVEGIKKMYDSKAAIDKRLSDYDAKHPDIAITTAWQQHKYAYSPNEETMREMEEAFRVKLQNIAEAGKAFARRQMSEGEMSEEEYVQLCAELDERVSGEWYRKEAEKAKQEKEKIDGFFRNQFYDSDDRHSLCSWCGGSLAGRSLEFGTYCSPKCRAEAK